MASLTQMERELLVERTHTGLEAARKRGRVGGRKRTMTDSKLAAAKRLLADDVPPKDVSMDLGISIPTLYTAGFQHLSEGNQIATGTFGGVSHPPNSLIRASQFQCFR